VLYASRDLGQSVDLVLTQCTSRNAPFHSDDTRVAAAARRREKSVPTCKAATDLVRKYYLFGEDRTGGVVYLWECRDAADRQYSPTWRSMIHPKFGAAPEITHYETPVIVDSGSA
jgi:hypothetical protein